MDISGYLTIGSFKVKHKQTVFLNLSGQPFVLDWRKKF